MINYIIKSYKGNENIGQNYYFYNCELQDNISRMIPDYQEFIEYDCEFYIKASLFDPMIKIEILDSIGTHLKTFNINVEKLTIKLENTK